MRRRSVLQSIAAFFAAGTRTRALARETRADFERRKRELETKLIANFPFERVQVRGEDALSAWQNLKAAGRGTPVVLGDNETLSRFGEFFDPSFPSPAKPVSEILDAAARIKIPEDLFARRKKEESSGREETAKLLSGPDSNLPTIIENRDAQGHVTSHIFQYQVGGAVQSPIPGGGNSRVLTPQETRTFLSKQSPSPSDGDWPSDQPGSTGLTVARDILTSKPLTNVNIALIPTDDWTTVPAYLRYGNWNDCPPPEVHVAALRSWRDRYGVELVGLGFDTMNLRAKSRPKTRQEALALAREQYAYCTDIVDQGTQTYSVLAASLMSDDWWFFWWD